MIEVTAATEIAASPETVWRLLTDLDGFTAGTRSSARRTAGAGITIAAALYRG